jgi:hypothetical protein
LSSTNQEVDVTWNRGKTIIKFCFEINSFHFIHKLGFKKKQLAFDEKLAEENISHVTTLAQQRQSRDHRCSTASDEPLAEQPRLFRDCVPLLRDDWNCSALWGLFMSRLLFEWKV